MRLLGIDLHIQKLGQSPTRSNQWAEPDPITGVHSNLKKAVTLMDGPTRADQVRHRVQLSNNTMPDVAHSIERANRERRWQPLLEAAMLRIATQKRTSILLAGDLAFHRQHPLTQPETYVSQTSAAAGTQTDPEAEANPSPCRVPD